MQIITNIEEISFETEYFPFFPEKWGKHVKADLDLFIVSEIDDCGDLGTCLMYQGVNVAESINGEEPFYNDKALYQDLIGVLGNLIGDAMPSMTEEEWLDWLAIEKEQEEHERREAEKIAAEKAEQRSRNVVSGGATIHKNKEEEIEWWYCDEDGKKNKIHYSTIEDIYNMYIKKKAWDEECGYF
jgi:hypothetical protein